MFDSAHDGSFRGLFVQGEDIVQSDPNTNHVTSALEALDIVIVQDLFLNETAAFAHVFFPGTSFLEKDGTFTNAERRINRVRKAMPSKVGRDEHWVACALATAMGYPMHYETTSEIMDEIARLTPTFRASASRSSTASAASSGPAPASRTTTPAWRSCTRRASPAVSAAS